MPVILPDDPPNPAQTKLGPLGQVMRPTSAAIAAAASGSKKKAKPKDPTAAAAVHLARAGADAGSVGTPGLVMSAAPGSMGGVVQPATTPVLSPQLASTPAPVSASVVLSAPHMIGMTMPTIAPAPEQHTPKKKGAPGTGAGGAAPAANGGPGAAGGGTGKKRGRPPEGLPPIVVASA